MVARERNKIGYKLAEIGVELAREPQRSRHRTHDESDDVVQVHVVGAAMQLGLSDAEERLIVEQHGSIRIV